jgi:hypothetical protein
MQSITKTRKIGGSLVITIPHILVDELNLHPNQAVKINVQKVKRSGFGMFSGIGKFCREDKFKGQLE